MTTLDEVLAKIAQAQGRDTPDLFKPVPFGTLTFEDGQVLVDAVEDGRLGDLNDTSAAALREKAGR